LGDSGAVWGGSQNISLAMGSHTVDIENRACAARRSIRLSSAYFLV